MTYPQDIKADDCPQLCDLIKCVALGVEQGVQSYDTFRSKLRELQRFMADRGHDVFLPYLD